MRMLVIVPSRSRGDILYKNAYRWLKNSNCDYRVFVEAHQQSQYSFVDNQNLVLLQKQRMGLGYALKSAKEWALEHGYDTIFKIDDDVRMFKTRYLHQPKADDEKTQLRVDIFNEVLDTCNDILFKNSRIGAIGFPYRNEMQEAVAYRVNKKLQTAYIVRLSCYNPEPAFTAQEDYMAYINVRKAGLDVLRLQKYAIDLALPVGEGKGGIQDFDRKAMAKSEMELIKSRYPSVVFKHKPEKSWEWEIDFSKSKF